MHSLTHSLFSETLLCMWISSNSLEHINKIIISIKPRQYLKKNAAWTTQGLMFYQMFRSAFHSLVRSLLSSCLLSSLSTDTSLCRRWVPAASGSSSHLSLRPLTSETSVLSLTVIISSCWRIERIARTLNVGPWSRVPRNRTILRGPDWVPGHVTSLSHLGCHTQCQRGKSKHCQNTNICCFNITICGSFWCAVS